MDVNAFLWTDIGHCWDSSEVTFQSLITDVTFGKFSKPVRYNIIIFFNSPKFPLCYGKAAGRPMFSNCSAWLHWCGTTYLKPFWAYSCVTVSYNVNYICPQESKYIRILLCNLLNKWYCIFLAFIQIIIQ